MALHHRTHPRYVPGCWACKVASVRIGPGDTNDEIWMRRRSDRRLVRDMEAYRRLRKDGLQPVRIDGCYQVEAKARTRWDVEGLEMYRDKPLHEALSERTGEEWRPAEPGEVPQ